MFSTLITELLHTHLTWIWEKRVILFVGKQGLALRRIYLPIIGLKVVTLPYPEVNLREFNISERKHTVFIIRN